jgi:AcrR family transcriptional regulator
VRTPLTRSLVVDAARAQLEREGAEHLSLRGLARELGVTAPALYAYVDDKDDLLAAVATQHFAALVARFEAIEADDPIDRIRALSRAYVDHARSSPNLFRLLFRYPPSAVDGADAFPPATRAFELAAAATADAVAAGQLGVADAALASMTMWAAIHGVAEVLLLGFGFNDETADALVESVIETVLAGQVRPLAARRP